MRLALLFCLLGMPAAALAQEPPTHLDDAVMDGTGVLWAYGGAPDQLYRFDGKEWTEQEAPLAPAKDAFATGLGKMADGAVACVWRLPDERLAVTRQLGTSVTLLGVCEGEIPRLGLVTGLTTLPLAHAQNELWITGSIPRIYRVDAKGVRLAYEIGPDELIPSRYAPQGYNRMNAVEDGAGRVWVWSDPAASNYASLRGVLVLSGEKSELHELTAGLKKGAAVLAVARADDRHMWVTVSSDGIYRVDIETFALERMPDPAEQALARVHELFTAGADLYAIDEDTGRDRTLWRWRGGQWTRLSAQLDPSRSHTVLPRSWLAIDEGVLVESSGGAPWFIPREGQPAQFSWQAGFSLEGAHAFARFPDGTFFALAYGGRIFHGALPLPPTARENARIAEIGSEMGWTLDAAGHPWTTLQESPEAISAWDGEKWVAHPIPGEAKQTRPATIIVDAENRLWVNPGTGGQRVHLFDIQTGQWQDFANIQAAYLALVDRPPHFPENGFYLFDPQYAREGQRIAYRIGVAELRYYDGTSWQLLDRAKITGEKQGDNALGPPWFDAGGNLCVNLRPGMTWRLDDEGHWSEVGFQSRYPKDIWSENTDNRTVRPEPPEGCVTARPESIVVDNFGASWLMWQRELYKCVPGHCIKVFGPDEVNPFGSTGELLSAFVDGRGNTFLRTTGARMQAFIVKPKSAPPHAGIAMQPIGADGMAVRFQTEAGSPVEFRWRLDDGPWETTRESELTLKSVPNGAHKLTVAAMDAELQTDANPATAAFEIRIDPERQIADLIGQLSAADFSQRAAAVKALAGQPERAGPALRKAREAAASDSRWWIEAALQKIEAAKATSTVPP